MNRVDIRAFCQFLQITFHIKLANTFIHRILIPYTDHNLLVRLEYFLINIAGHLADRLLILTTISFRETFRLTLSGQVYLPPVIGIVNQHTVSISSPTCNTVSRGRCRFIIVFFKYGIADSSRDIGHFARSSIKFIPDFRNRVVHHRPFAVCRPSWVYTIATSYQLLFSCLYIDGIHIKRNFIKPFFLHPVRGFVYIEHMVNLLRAVRLQ